MTLSGLPLVFSIYRRNVDHADRLHRTGRPAFRRSRSPSDYAVGFEHSRRIPFHDVICRLGLTDIFNAVQLVRRLKDDRARSESLHLSIIQDFNRSFFDDDQFLVRVLVRLVRCRARIERRDMTFQFIERRRRRLKELHARAHL